MKRHFLAIALGTHVGLLSVSPLTIALADIRPTTPPAWYNCMTREVWSPEKQAWCNQLRSLQGQTYNIPDYGSVTLTNGSFENTEKRFSVKLVNRQGWVHFGDLNEDGKTDVVFPLFVNSGGSGQFVYLTTVLDVSGTPKVLPSVLLGDRVKLNRIDILNQQVRVDMVTQGPQDPLCCPTLPVKWSYQLDAAEGAIVANQSAPKPIANPKPLPTKPVAKDTLVFVETAKYAARVFQKQGKPVLNLYNKETQVLELNAAPVQRKVTGTGTGYTYTGEMTVSVAQTKDGAKLLEVNGIPQNTDMNAASATVTGTVSYLQRIAMPPEATLEVRLLDVSRQDAPAEVLASETISFEGRQVPIPFSLTYDPAKIQENHTYTVDARILVDGKLRFISDTAHQVITRDNPSTVEIIVKPVK